MPVRTELAEIRRPPPVLLRGRFSGRLPPSDDEFVSSMSMVLIPWILGGVFEIWPWAL